jgi:hypothetical protein
MSRLRPPPPRSILLTGASSGIGAALARHYAGPGIRLALGGRHRARLAAVVADCRQAGTEVAGHCVDVTDRATMTAWIEAVDREAPLDLAIANAGVAGNQLPPGPERTRTIFAVNLIGVHGLDDVVVGDPQTPLDEHLDREVTVAEVPGEARQMAWVVGGNVEHVLVGGVDHEPASRLEGEPVALGQRRRLREIQKHRLALVGREPDATPVAVLEGERNTDPLKN